METGLLYVVATPIGNLDDITIRALDILKSVDLILAEDTRHSKKLLNHYSVTPPLKSYHKENEDAQIATIVQDLLEGKNIALISDAGTPAISDPGSKLVQAVLANDLRVVPIPGPSALAAALSVSGVASQDFSFVGFLTPASQKRQQRLDALKYATGSLVFFEAPHRIIKFFEAVKESWGDDREFVLTKELTKMFETIRKGTVHQHLQWLLADDKHSLGEFVLISIPPVDDSSADFDEHLQVLQILLNELPLSQAVKLAVKITGGDKNKLYQAALAHKK